MLRRGYTLIELLTALVILGVLLAGLLQVITSMESANTFTSRMPTVQQDAVDVVRKLAESLRGATICTSGDSGCSLNAAMEAPSGSAITIYRRASNGTLSLVTYRIQNGNFERVVNSAATTLVENASLSLVYYRSDGYNSNSLDVSDDPGSELSAIIAVGITATVTRNGLTGTYTTLIRLRNSPVKLFTG